jgi:hypothetical protein
VAQVAAAAPHLHTIGDHEILDSRVVNALSPLNAIVYVIDCDCNAECLEKSSLIQMLRLFDG